MNAAVAEVMERFNARARPAQPPRHNSPGKYVYVCWRPHKQRYVPSANEWETRFEDDLCFTVGMSNNMQLVTLLHRAVQQIKAKRPGVDIVAGVDDGFTIDYLRRTDLWRRPLKELRIRHRDTVWFSDIPIF